MSNVHIDVVREIPFSELEGLVRSVPLNKPDEDGSKIFVYEDANIAFREFATDEINPTSFYALQKNLAFQRSLREQLLEQYCIDSLHLRAAYEIVNKDTNEQWSLLPPIVELMKRRVTYAPKEGEICHTRAVDIMIPAINDGLHRVMTARESGESISCVYITGIPQEHPFYAHPNSWDDVVIVDEVPKTKNEKKLYSRADCYALYRDFGVLGCGAPRSPQDNKR